MLRELGTIGADSWGMWLLPIIIWTAFWKGLALWKSARSGEKWWFLALLLINTMGILELVYLFVFAKNKLTIAEVQKTITKKIEK